MIIAQQASTKKPSSGHGSVDGLNCRPSQFDKVADEIKSSFQLEKHHVFAGTISTYPRLSQRFVDAAISFYILVGRISHCLLACTCFRLIPHFGRCNPNGCCINPLFCWLNQIACWSNQHVSRSNQFVGQISISACCCWQNQHVLDQISIFFG